MNSLTKQIQVDKIVNELKKEGVYKPEFNIVGLEELSFFNSTFRSEKQAADRWNDCIIIIKYNNKTKQDEIIAAYSATTEPGRFYTLNPMNRAGAARLCFGSFKDSWGFGMHGVKAPHFALIQRQAVSVCRDLNNDFSRLNDKIFSGIYGINIHAAVGSPDFMASIGLYSAGCLVIRSYAQQKIFMSLCRQSGLSRFSCSLFDGSAVVPASQKVLVPAIGAKPGYWN